MADRFFRGGVATTMNCLRVRDDVELFRGDDLLAQGVLRAAQTFQLVTDVVIRHLHHAKSGAVLARQGLHDRAGNLGEEIFAREPVQEGIRCQMVQRWTSSPEEPTKRAGSRGSTLLASVSKFPPLLYLPNTASIVETAAKYSATRRVTPKTPPTCVAMEKLRSTSRPLSEARIVPRRPIITSSCPAFRSATPLWKRSSKPSRRNSSGVRDLRPDWM